MGIICATKPGVFNSQAYGQLKSQMGDAYSVCAITCAWGICKIAHEKKLGPVSFVYETGRPNADFVERAIKALQRHNDPEVNIASISMVKKEECPYVTTADFLSHVYGSKSYNANDAHWYDYLVRNGNVLHTELTEDKLDEMSKLIKEHFTDKRQWKRIKRTIDRFNETNSIKFTL